MSATGATQGVISPSLQRRNCLTCHTVAATVFERDFRQIVVARAAEARRRLQPGLHHFQRTCYHGAGRAGQSRGRNISKLKFDAAVRNGQGPWGGGWSEGAKKKTNEIHVQYTTDLNVYPYPPDMRWIAVSRECCDCDILLFGLELFRPVVPWCSRKLIHNTVGIEERSKKRKFDNKSSRQTR